MKSRRRTVLAAMGVAGATPLSLGTLAVSLDNTNSTSETAAGDVTFETAIREVHENGITGSGVSVGVLDVQGFDLTHRILENRVVATRQFGDAAPVDNGAYHGTATAATVLRVAPDIDLYAGTFETAAEYETGLEWLLDHDIDVVVAPVAYAGTLANGESALSQASNNAIEEGAIVVAPAGNLATGHWLGKYNPTERGLHMFSDGPLNDVIGPETRGEFWLTHDGSAEYTLELHRIEDGGTDLLAESVPYEEHNERLTVQLEDDQYAIVIRGPTNATGATIRVASPTHSLANNRESRSVAAPAAASGTISVGAYDPATDELEPFSSRGPTPDGRLGVDVVAPSSHPVLGETEPFIGTSAAAAAVGGVTALMIETAPDLNPAEIRWGLSRTADPVDGIDAESGHGVVDIETAVEEAERGITTPDERE